MARDTIAALASGRPPSAIAVVRVSGPQAFAAVRAVAGTLPASRRAGLRVLRRDDGALLDRALVLTFPGPTSATGEDVAELHLHGGAAVIAAVLEALTAQPGVRLAEPGEFTRRAFDNGRLDLTQVEGMADLIAATTEAQRAQAAAQMQGALAALVNVWRAALLDALALDEAGIDFADEGDVGDAGADAGDLASIMEGMACALMGAARGERLREGLSVVLVGPPNVGKSSLLNALAGREAAIVSAVAGTTRDPVSVDMDLGGVPVTLVDTAGLRESDDPVEVEGVARARARAARADLVLQLSDDGMFAGEGLRVWTKADVFGQEAGQRDGEFHVSARTGAGVGELIASLARWAREEVSADEPALVARARQAEALRDAVTCLGEHGAERDAVLRAESLRLAVRALDRLTGGVDVEDVLDRIFSRFCIGK